ncbi:MAG: hypothetical protein B6240_01935 [Desulfobacteraceae bacterium 4572_87]|nr:MAG: hypothetical protein B6240_01935 [Desulfobacteraceae bacterium 4572_87]
MKNKNPLIELVHDKCEGSPYDVEQYVEWMDMLISKVYRARYKFRDKGPEGDFDFHTFSNDCWTKLEDGGLIRSFYDASFANDAHLTAYTRKTFENLLLDQVQALSPGFRTRLKQLQRVLKPPVTLYSCKEYCKCWKLPRFKEQSIAPADTDRLLKKSIGISLPKLHISKKPDSQRGPWIYDRDMKDYLLHVLEKAGGMTTQQNLNSFLSTQYGLHPVRKVIPSESSSDSGDKEITQEESLEKMAFGVKDFFMGADHIKMAQDLVNGMTDEMRTVFHRLVVCERTIEQTSGELNKSVGTIYNIKKSYEKHFFRFFHDPESGFSAEEMEGVIGLVCELFESMRGTL